MSFRPRVPGPWGVGVGTALVAVGLPFLLVVLLLGSPARAEGSATVAQPTDPAALDAYDPLFDDEPQDQGGLEHDPFESANRKTFAFNQGLDRWVLDPVTYGYQWLVPGPARRSLNRVMQNANSPVIFVNEVLQLRADAAGVTLGRFVANTILGIGGLFDVAADEMGIEPDDADFGQTLACYGVPRGPYLILPVFGPTTAREVVGGIVDQTMAPLNYVFGPLSLQWQLIRGSGEGLVLRDANIEALDALRNASVDYYSSLRSAYLQSRRAMELQVQWRRNEPEDATPESSGDDPEPGASAPLANDTAADQDLAPDASFSMRASMAAISASKFSRLTMPENSERRSASSLTVPSR